MNDLSRLQAPEALVKVELQRLRRIQILALDFDGVLTDNCVIVDQEGRESVRCWRSDGTGMTRLRSTGVRIVILSSEINPVVSVRASKLSVPCRQGVDDKSTAIRDIASEAGVGLEDVAFVGNDINDIPALDVVGLPIAVADAYAEILPHVRYQTRRRGGRGAVREICDLIYTAKVGDESIGIPDAD